MEMKKVLWPTDFSGRSAQALPYVTSLTEKYGTEIHVLFVIEDLTKHKGWYGEFDQERVEKLMNWEQQAAKKKLDQICQNRLQGCPLYIKHIAVGDPAEEILKLVEQEKVDMVVMATRGQEGKFSFGSVAEKVVKNSPVPVVTIPPAAGS
jgi:nucleotide-binding universal stress UspA family protein